MKSLLFCTSYVQDRQAWDDRIGRWIAYYGRAGLTDAQLVVIDDGSPYVPPPSEIVHVAASAPLPDAVGKPYLVRFPDRLGRQGHLSYPGWWRSFLHAIPVARALGARKLIHVESDAFILSRRLLHFIDGLDSGWTTFWSSHYGMPESAIQVICEDQFDTMHLMAEPSRRGFDGLLAEHVLPFTAIDRSFKGDRYGEFRRRRGIFRSRRFDDIPLFNTDFFWLPVPADADFATQVRPRQSLRSEICLGGCQGWAKDRGVAAPG